MGQVEFAACLARRYVRARTPDRIALHLDHPDGYFASDRLPLGIGCCCCPRCPAYHPNRWSVRLGPVAMETVPDLVGLPVSLGPAVDLAAHPIDYWVVVHFAHSNFVARFALIVVRFAGPAIVADPVGLAVDRSGSADPVVGLVGLAAVRSDSAADWVAGLVVDRSVSAAGSDFVVADLVGFAGPPD